MKNKTILIIVISAVAAILAVVILVVLLNKKPAQQTASLPSGSTGSGGITSGASPDTGNKISPALVAVGSGVVSVLVPHTDATQPYSTTKPRVESPKNNNGSTVALQPASSETQQTATQGTDGQIAYNYNQSDDSFLNQYYPDAQQVISGQEGPAGNNGQDPANQVLYVTSAPTATGPALTAAPDPIDTSTFQTSSDNSPSAILAYLQALAAATAPFDIVNDTSLVTAPLQNFSLSAATSSGQQATAVLQSIQALTVPSSLTNLQASFVDAYQQFITYTGQLAVFFNAGPSSIDSEEGTLESTVTGISTVLNIAQTNYQNTYNYYSGSTSSQ